MARKIVAFILGLLAGNAFNISIVMVSQAMYPLPKNVDSNDFAAVRAHIESNGMALGALILVLIAHAGGSFVGGFVCGLVAKRQWYVAAGVLGALWTCGGITMLFLLPAPLWFAITDTVAYIPAALAGVFLGGSLTRAKAETAIAAS